MLPMLRTQVRDLTDQHTRTRQPGDKAANSPPSPGRQAQPFHPVLRVLDELVLLCRGARNDALAGLLQLSCCQQG